MAGVRRICARELDLEPDAGELPGILARGTGHLGLVAEEGGALAGVCFGSLARLAVNDTRTGHVELLAVSRESRGRGIGRRLLAEMESLLRGKGAAVALLRGNPPTYVWPGVNAGYTVM